MMESEYQFNYDKIKQIFESVPQTNSTTKSSRTISYKTHFQPRTKLPDNTHSNICPLISNNINQIPSTILVQMQFFHVYQMVPIQPCFLQIQQDFYR
ncbi:unnamed protein product [Adineta steineri]|uniref:Uncharacterized protein n=1 Tax=Adineta steineri TaxID=433720 RepID=A0A814UTR5_9BILA|nr:unnamed protein product [Adineta steineri]CAF1441095.1 unnamed protein product [Adineta steineri]CAF3762181.1 unnamed protein product [Adineta steineri]CAF3909774.1 unnamed protein product [Adineta steineri]